MGTLLNILVVCKGRVREKGETKEEEEENAACGESLRIKEHPLLVTVEGITHDEQS